MLILIAAAALMAILVLLGVSLSVAALWIHRYRIRRAMRSLEVNFKRGVRTESRVLSVARLWLTTMLAVGAIASYAYVLSQPLSLLAHLIALLGYVLALSALGTSLFARLPIVQSAWRDPSRRLLMWAMPPFLVFVAKGYAGLWIGEQLGTSWVNVSYTLVAGMVFLLCLIPAFVLAALALVFEVVLLVSLLGPSAVNGRERRIGMIALASAFFIAVLVGVNATAEVVGGRLGNALLLASAFEFDATPATYCELDKDERQLATQPDPHIKALHLGSSQERALLIRRSPALFSPTTLKDLRQEAKNSRRIEVLRITECYQLPRTGRLLSED